MISVLAARVLVRCLYITAAF